MTVQFPYAFEFNEHFLVTILDHLYRLVTPLPLSFPLSLYFMSNLLDPLYMFVDCVY